MILFICYLAAITSDISYIPALLPARNLAASIAPFANTDLEYAVCVNSITSSSPANITSCTPTIVPPRTALIPISLGSLAALSWLLSYLYSSHHQALPLWNQQVQVLYHLVHQPFYYDAFQLSPHQILLVQES